MWKYRRVGELQLELKGMRAVCPGDTGRISHRWFQLLLQALLRRLPRRDARLTNTRYKSRPGHGEWNGCGVDWAAAQCTRVSGIISGVTVQVFSHTV